MNYLLTFIFKQFIEKKEEKQKKNIASTHENMKNDENRKTMDVYYQYGFRFYLSNILIQKQRIIFILAIWNKIKRK